ncbi:MAG: thioredoxin family protein [Candidatus Aminicenantes bacterium]|nr:thioredoxin family protein [Candidatus Aminicenantes bacterium]
MRHNIKHIKHAMILPLLLFFCLFCASKSEEQTGDQTTEQQADSHDSLIIQDAQPDFSQFKVTFIELGADKCIPCKAMQPVMKEIAQEYKGTIQVVFYDVWKTPQFAQDYNIQLIPTQVFIDKNGDEIFRHVGFFAKEDIIGMLKEKSILSFK